MHATIHKLVTCPNCGEAITLMINYEDIENAYTEDCQVCCKPMIVVPFINPQNELDAYVSRDGDSDY